MTTDSVCDTVVNYVRDYVHLRVSGAAFQEVADGAVSRVQENNSHIVRPVTGGEF